MTWSMQPNGTVDAWKTPAGVNVLFPETELMIEDKKKPRGGAPVCVPNFGTAPTDGPYKGTALPSHGFVRDCRMHNGQPTAGNRALGQGGPTTIDGWTSTIFYFGDPWPHEVYISARTTESTEGALWQQMQHFIRLKNKQSGNLEMPYSIGFHPYFATHGEPYSLHYGLSNWESGDLLINDPFFVPCRPGEHFTIQTSQGTVRLDLKDGYTGFFVWADRPNLYICVEPVCVGNTERYRMLGPDPIECQCVMTYIPHP